MVARASFSDALLERSCWSLDSRLYTRRGMESVWSDMRWTRREAEGEAAGSEDIRDVR